jgi:predicted  nucleic acid-binding Zn-ribbon protein
MSLEELKRVTEAHDGISQLLRALNLDMKLQWDGAREKHRQEYEAQKNTIHDLQKRLEELEEQSTQKRDLIQKAGMMEIELREKQRALEEAEVNEKALKEEIEQLRQEIEMAKTQLANVLDLRNVAECRQQRRRNLWMNYILTGIPWLFL